MIIFTVLTVFFAILRYQNPQRASVGAKNSAKQTSVKWDSSTALVPRIAQRRKTGLKLDQTRMNLTNDRLSLAAAVMCVPHGRVCTLIRNNASHDCGLRAGSFAQLDVGNLGAATKSSGSWHTDGFQNSVDPLCVLGPTKAYATDSLNRPETWQRYSAGGLEAEEPIPV